MLVMSCEVMIGWGLPDRRNALGERKPCPLKVHKKEDLVTTQLQ